MVDLRVHTQPRIIMEKVFNKFNISSIKQKRQIVEWLQVYKEVKKTTGLSVICHTTPNMDSWADAAYEIQFLQKTIYKPGALA